MSPATYNGGKPPCSPHSQMQAMDEQGESYWVENVQLTNGAEIDRADVMSHTPEWLRLRTPAEGFLEEREWTVQTAHIVRFRIVEG